MISTKHILVVDDDDDDRLIFSESVEEVNRGLKISEASGGKQAIKMLETMTVPDVIFLDLNMPVFNGFDCLKNFKSQQHTRDIPVVIYSTTTDNFFIEKAYDGGANLFISKPHCDKDLVIILEKFFKLPKE